ncbi:MAG: 2-amino-4-hydroxy-6-hydroxymethyldihydropteridine diphosphokinase [Candidatus Melainabacteria bacterium]|nr:2-amino-4-hydroxy-6-hydroxymethyldihydropteridine diphosphokinase [Candidatus Melainabacteria bacterium]
MSSLWLPACLSLGSNQGDRLAHLIYAVSRLEEAAGIEILARSAVYETQPVGIVDQPAFLNAVLLIETQLAPDALLDTCLAIEQQCGRVRTLENRWGPRTLDVDVIAFDHCVLQTERLTLPHPRMHERAFVLVPMLEVLPAWQHPVLNKTIESLHADLVDVSVVEFYLPSVTSPDRQRLHEWMAFVVKPSLNRTAPR